jgi:hypothetical protein
MKILQTFLVIVMLLGGTGVIYAGDVVVKDNHLKFLGINYFRTGADRVTLGAYGEKKSPILQGNYLEVQDTLPVPKLDGKIKSAAIVTIDWSKSTEADIMANIGALKVVNTGVKITYSGLKSGSLKLVHLIILANEIRNAANHSPKAIDNLASYGSDARIAHEIFVVMNAELASSFTTGVSFDVKASVGGGITVTSKGSASNSRSTIVTLSQGTTFAYLLVKLDWAKKKASIEKCTDDQWGPS